MTLRQRCASGRPRNVFRHSFATWAYERVRDPLKLQKLMRHASFQTSMGYVQDGSDMADVVNMLPALSQARLQAV
jgi:integrase